MVDGRVEAGEQGWRWLSGVHRMLLRLAGQVPDEWLTYARGLLADGELVSLPSIVCASMVEYGVPLTVGEVALLREIHHTVFGDVDLVGVDLVRVSDAGSPVRHRFLPVAGSVWAPNAGRIPSSLDLTGGPSRDLWDLPPALSHLDDIASWLTDIEDRLVVAELSVDDEVLSVARAWRFPAEGALDDGVRVLLVEVAEFALAEAVTGATQRALVEDGVVDPQVEVFWSGMDLPAYHRAALAGSVLLWTVDRNGG